MASDARDLHNAPIEIVKSHGASMSTESSNASTSEYASHRGDLVNEFRPLGMTTDGTKWACSINLNVAYLTQSLSRYAARTILG